MGTADNGSVRQGVVAVDLGVVVVDSVVGDAEHEANANTTELGNSKRVTIATNLFTCINLPVI